MKISILLPYKENFSPVYAGAVSLFVKDTTKISEFNPEIGTQFLPLKLNGELIL